jgi:tape measure domain-containing protein
MPVSLASLNSKIVVDGVQEAIRRIALALGQVQAKGKLAGGEMMQLTETGLNVRGILTDAFHKTPEEIVKMQERGLIPADKAIKAIIESLERDFGGAAKRQAGTWAGLLNSLEDIKNVGLREFFTGTFQAVQPLLNDFVTKLSDPAILANIHAWGVGLGNFTTTGVTALQTAIANIQALTPVIVGAGAAWIGYQIAQNAATIATGASAAATLITSAAESARVVVLIAQTQGLGAATAATWTNIGANGRLALTLGVVAIAAAVTVAYFKWKEIQDQIAQGVQDTAAKTRGWQESADALDRYNKLAPAAQAASQGEASSLTQLRDAQEKAIDAYARHKIAGKSLYESSAHYEAQLQAERDAINARSTALQLASNGLQSHISYEDIENNRLQISAGLTKSVADRTAELVNKTQQLIAVTQESANKTLLDAEAKKAVKAQTELLEAKTKLLGERYMALHPNITIIEQVLERAKAWKPELFS